MNNKRGLTFVELMIVVSLTAVVGIAVSAALGSAVDMWGRINETVVEEDVAIFFDKFSTVLRNTILCEGIAFVGGENSISIPTRRLKRLPIRLKRFFSIRSSKPTRILLPRRHLRIRWWTRRKTRSITKYTTSRRMR